MTLEILQQEMIKAMKTDNKFRKTVISGFIANIKKVAIDKNCRDNITEDLVNEVLLKTVKTIQESVDSCPETRLDLKNRYEDELKIAKEFAPSIINNPERIAEIIRDEYEGEMNKGKLMKFLNQNYKGKMDMGIASKVVGELIK